MGGVRYRGGVLRLRPTMGATTLGLYSNLFALVMVAIGVVARNLFAATAGAIMLALGSQYLLCRVTAANGTILVTNKRRRYRVSIAEVRLVRTDEFRPALGFWPFSNPINRWPRPLSAVVLSLRDGTEVRCDALVGLVRDSRMEELTPIEIKAAILQRWIEAAVP